MEAGAWPFLVGGVICLVKSDNERDLNQLNSNGNKGVAVMSGLLGVSVTPKHLLLEYTS